MKPKKLNTIARIGIGISLILLGVASRTVFSRNFAFPWVPIFGNNFEVITVIGVVAGLIFGIRQGWIVPLLAMVGSDLLLGNNPEIVWFTWTGFVIPAVIGGVVKKLTTKSSGGRQAAHRAVGGLGGSLFSVLIFFAWTNFGVWLSWYPKTVEGLIRCYTVAIPFLVSQLKGNLLVGGLVFGAYLCVSFFAKSSIIYKADRLIRRFRYETKSKPRT